MLIKYIIIVKIGGANVKRTTVNTEKASIKDCATFINMPISSDEDDKIGISQHAQEIKNAIEKGAQTIAITSDFGGGKSSLIKYLEKLYSSITTKFCYVNLWAELKDYDPHELHRSFIYQLANQISKRKGKYVSKRLSKNYGLLKIGLQNRLMSFISYIMIAALSIGILFIPLYDSVLVRVFGDETFRDSHINIGIFAFLSSLLIGILLIYKADIVFSYKDSANGSREINEHELMDIYRSYICNYHFRHYIVILEDLDRTDDTEKVLRFIRELRRYYIPTSPKQFKNNFIREKVNKLITFLKLNNRNRITFIVNIKPEYQLKPNNGKDGMGHEDTVSNEQSEHDCEGEKSLYPKIFDYTLNLKRIHIDNYDVILTKLLEDNKDLFERNGIPVFENNIIISDFEWLKRGPNLNIRELKNRLNVSFSTYLNLIKKFNDNSNISLPKCIAVGYITVAFEEDYNKVEKYGFDEILDIFLKDKQRLTEPLILQYYANKSVDISPKFAAELLKLIKSRLISFDYKQYFYNFPIGSYLRTNDENRLFNILLYDSDVALNELDELVKNVLLKNSTVIDDAYKRLKQLNLNCPKCIFQSDSLMQYSIYRHQEMVIGTISNELQYDDKSMTVTSQILTDTIKKYLLNNQEVIDKICHLVISKANPPGIITFRKEILNSMIEDINKFSSLYTTETPLITKQEASDLKNEKVFSFINYKSTDFFIDFLNNIHSIIISENFNISSKDTLDTIVSFYSHAYEILGETENMQLTNLMFEFMVRYVVIPSTLENLIVSNNDFDNIRSKYTALVDLYGQNKEISKNTIEILDNNNVISGLSVHVCKQLFNSGYFKLFIANAFYTKINLIDISNDSIKETILSIDFYNGNDLQVSERLLIGLRTYIIQTNFDLATNYYNSLFFGGNCLITKSELKLIEQKTMAIKLINTDKLSEDNINYIANYFSDRFVNLKDAYKVLLFVSSINKPDIKRKTFSLLDFDNLQYYRIANDKKTVIKSNMKDVFDFSKANDMFTFMRITKASDLNFEKAINTAIKSGTFSTNESAYIQYIKTVKNLTLEAIENVCAFDSVHPFPLHVLNEFYRNKKYKYYVVSRILFYNIFAFEEKKLQNLGETYIDLFISKSTNEDIIEKMAKSKSFLEFLIAEESYVGLPESKRTFFSSVLQTKELLQDLKNYPINFQIIYLSKIEGFKDEFAATYYVQMMNLNPVLGRNQQLYDHNHEKLVSPSLKRTYTKFHKR